MQRKRSGNNLTVKTNKKRVSESSFLYSGNKLFSDLLSRISLSPPPVSFLVCLWVFYVVPGGMHLSSLYAVDCSFRGEVSSLGSMIWKTRHCPWTLWKISYLQTLIHQPKMFSQTVVNVQRPVTFTRRKCFLFIACCAWHLVSGMRSSRALGELKGLGTLDIGKGRNWFWLSQHPT